MTPTAVALWGATFVCAGMLAAACGATAASPDAGRSGTSMDAGRDSAHSPGSGSGSGSSNSGTGSGSGANGTGSGSSSGSGSDAGSDAGVLTATVLFEQCLGSSLCGPAGSFDFSASFHVLADCAMTTSGACTLSTCQTAPVSGDDAGNVTISGGSIAAGASVMSFGDGVYSYAALGAVMTGGQSVTVSASGGTVPTFGPQSVTAPSLVTLTSPSVSDAGTTMISTATDVTIAWSGGQTGATMTLSLSSQVSQSSLACSWAASSGQGTIPHALLSQLVGQAQGGVLTYGQEATRTFMAGPYSIAESALLYSEASVSFE